MYISIFSYSLRYNISIFSLVNLNTIFTDNQKFNIEMKQVSSKPTTFEKEINSDNTQTIQVKMKLLFIHFFVLL